MRGRIMGIFSFGRLGLRVVNGPFFTVLNKLVIFSAAGVFATNAITLTAAATIVTLITLSLMFLVPNVIKQK